MSDPKQAPPEETPAVHKPKDLDEKDLAQVSGGSAGGNNLKLDHKTEQCANGKH